MFTIKCYLKLICWNLQRFFSYTSRVWLIFLKCCRENLSFQNLMLGEKEWKYITQQTFPAHRTINFSQLVKKNLLSQTIVSQAQLTFIWLNSTIIIMKSKICPKLSIEALEVAVVFIINFKYIWFVVLVFFFADFKHVNSRWNTLLP